MDGPERFSGTLLFSGKKYRVQTASQTIVTDGKVLWIYNKSEQQVIINDFVQDESSFSLTAMLQQLGNNYDASLEDRVKRDGIEQDVLKLVPTNDDVQFQQVILHIRSTDTVVTHLEVLDFNDVLMVFDLSDIKVNPKVDAASFSFTPPPGVERIDLRN